MREVICPNRQQRRRYGKSDQADAIGAARAVLASRVLNSASRPGRRSIYQVFRIAISARKGVLPHPASEATGTPKAGTGDVESIRLLRVARRSANKARTQAAIRSTPCSTPRQPSCANDSGNQPSRSSSRQPGCAAGSLPPRSRRSAHPAHSRSSLATPRRGARHARRPPRRLHQNRRADPARHERCRATNRHRSARRDRRQPGSSPKRRLLRRRGRRISHRRLRRPTARPPPQPPRRPPSQLGTPHHRHLPAPLAQPTQAYMARCLAEGRSRRAIVRCLIGRVWGARRLVEVPCLSVNAGR